MRQVSPSANVDTTLQLVDISKPVEPPLVEMPKMARVVFAYQRSFFTKFMRAPNNDSVPRHAKHLLKQTLRVRNMLYDMVAYSINKGFKEIIFARTALEIKSSIGAKPQEMYGLGQHTNKIVDLAFEKVFCYLEPTVVWQERNPFK